MWFLICCSTDSSSPCHLCDLCGESRRWRTRGARRRRRDAMDACSRRRAGGEATRRPLNKGHGHERRVRRPRARPPRLLRDERAHQMIGERAADVVVPFSTNNVVPFVVHVQKLEELGRPRPGEPRRRHSITNGDVRQRMHVRVQRVPDRRVQQHARREAHKCMFQFITHEPESR